MSYVIWYTHPSLLTQGKVDGADKADCLKALRDWYPDGGYKIVSQGRDD